MKGSARAIGAELRAATPAQRQRWKAIIKALARLLRVAFRELPSGLLLAVAGGATELIVKMKAGFNGQKMLTAARQADADVNEIVTELQEEIERESRQEEQQGLELGSRDPAIPDPGRGPGPGAAPAAEGAEDDGPTLAPGVRRASRH